MNATVETTKVPTNDIHPIAAKLVEQFAQWDDVERCWELFVPFPPHIIVEADTSVPMLDWMMDVADVIESIEGLSYNNMGIDTDAGTVSLVGLTW